MGPTPEIDPTILAPFVIVMLVVSLFLWLGMLGGSLKLSFIMLSSDSPSYLRCLLASVLILIVNIGVFVAMLVVLGPQPWYIVAAYQFFLQVLVVSLVVKRNPLVSVVATFLHSLIVGVGTVAGVIMVVIATGSALSGLQERGSLLFAKAQNAMTGINDHSPDANQTLLSENINPIGNAEVLPEATPVGNPLPVSIPGEKKTPLKKPASGVTSNPFLK